MRAEIDVAARTVNEHARRDRQRIQKHPCDRVGQPIRERTRGEDGSDVRIRELVGNLRPRRERIDEHRAASFRRGEGGDERGRCGEKNCRAVLVQRPNERRAALEQGEASGNELLDLETIDVPAAGGNREWKEAERVAHGPKAYNSKRDMAPLSRFAISARCWLDSETCVIDAVCCSTTALTSCEVAAFWSATAAIASISRASASASSRCASLASTMSAMASRLLSISVEMRVSDAADVRITDSPFATRSLTSAIRSAVRSDALRISAASLRIVSSARALSPASFRTSSATTANPLPCSPARAASIAALSASKFVCRAIAPIVSVTLPMRCDFSPSSATTGTASFVTALIDAMLSSASAADSAPRRADATTDSPARCALRA